MGYTWPHMSECYKDEGGTRKQQSDLRNQQAVATHESTLLALSL